MGRNGIAAWSFEGGEWHGVDFTGVKVAVLMSHEKVNLVEIKPGTHQVRYIVDAPDEMTGRRIVTWINNKLQPQGRPGSWETVFADVSFTRDGTYFRVASTGLFEVRGDAVADGSCCSQPENRWYETFDSRITGVAVVGVPDVCEVLKQGDLESWRHAGENNVQLASF